MLEFLVNLSSKEDLVVVGSAAWMMHGMEITPTDIDVVVNNTEMPIRPVEYTTDSPYSFTGRRAFLKDVTEYPVDIFIEDFTPEFIMINGVRCATIEYSINFIKAILPGVKVEYWRLDLESKLTMLENFRNEK